MYSDTSKAQEQVARKAIEVLAVVESDPKDGTYLGLDEAKRIVDETLRTVDRDSVEGIYLNGHRKRLIETLAITPKASRKGATMLEIGCYGYFGIWANQHLGYDRVVGTEMPLESGEKITTKTLSLGGYSFDMEVHHFDLTQPEWPLQEMFDTVICLEVVEHLDDDPSGVLLRLRERMKPDATLVLSMPNSVSYKTLGEFISGMPPWTYWFYHPDLAHEPRHSLEYTPILASIFLTGAGFELASLKSIDAYADREAVADLYEIGEALGRDPDLFGETIIATARKTKEHPPVRFPDAIYGGDKYYKSTWPMIDKIKSAAAEKAVARLRTDKPQPSEAERVLQSEQVALEAELADTRLALERATLDLREKSLQVEEMSFLLDSYDRKLRTLSGTHHATSRTPVSPGTDRRALLLYRLLSPARIRILAEQAKLPDQTKWTRQLMRHPFRISEWRGLKRLLRRIERGEYRAEIEAEFQHRPK